jgi:hypothetical protein
MRGRTLYRDTAFLGRIMRRPVLLRKFELAKTALNR